MKIEKVHTIAIYVNGDLIDIDNQNQLNLRINNTVIDPTSLSTTQSEYSYEFDLPVTPNNNRIFDFANIPSKNAKFRKRFNCDVYSDGTLLFNGTLIIKSIKDNHYTCNLVQMKVYDLNDIFDDDDKLNKLTWEVPFDGFKTINDVNKDSTTKYYFPFVSYGAFQKDPAASDDISSEYTSRWDLDNYNKWYYSTFQPSLNMLEVVKKCFEYKGYQVHGTAFNDDVLNNIYMSCNLADGQVPIYNIGNPKFGSCDLTVEWKNYGTSGVSENSSIDLTFPYGPYLGNYMHKNDVDSDDTTYLNRTGYTFPTVREYDMMKGKYSKVTENSDTYLYDNGEHCIVIPADGFYRITVDYDMEWNLTAFGNTLKCYGRYSMLGAGGDMDDDIVTVHLDDIQKNYLTYQNLAYSFPFEIQLVKNFQDSEKIELIGSAHKPEYKFSNVGPITIGNEMVDIPTAFPHEPLTRNMQVYGAHQTCKGIKIRKGYTPLYSPTDIGELTYNTVRRNLYKDASTSTGGRTFGNLQIKNATLGYSPKSTMLLYDPAVNPDFICGCSSYSYNGGTASVIKDGYSWSRTNNVHTDDLYTSYGYDKLYLTLTDEKETLHTINTKYQERAFKNASNAYYTTYSPTKTHASTQQWIWLNKNDVLTLHAIQKYYESSNDSDNVYYGNSAKVHIMIDAMTDSSVEIVRNNAYYNDSTSFPKNLQLENFLNEETNMSDFISSILNAYNLQMRQDGKQIFIDKNNFSPDINNGAVDIDDRVNLKNAEIQQIDYPKTLSIQYQTSTEEWGFEQTVPKEHINDKDWEKYGDKGYDKITLDEFGEKDTTQSLQFSYTWYDNFNWIGYDENGKRVTFGNLGNVISIPVISKSTYMVDGYDYEESMKHDGYSLKQRFWFRQPYKTDWYEWSTSTPKEKVYLQPPVNQYKGVNLSYKLSEKSILTEYFNVMPYLSSNYLTIDVYLTPQEYNLLKNGGNVIIDNDVYYVSSIEGFDCTGNNPTTLKLIKSI